MPRILMIEDNEMNRDMLSRRLRRRGFDVVLAVNGAEGIRMAQTESPDLILMDLNMPDVDGWEAARLLKQSPDTKHLPIIALTAHEAPGNRERLIATGCAEYHTKPVQLPLLVSQIETILKKLRSDVP
ncbi:response regulator [Novipirellula sp.]|uniref:response regulator n=1 Tax=Novipirellula sp. TaxID=2795430 RepID=UPI003567C411